MSSNPDQAMCYRYKLCDAVCQRLAAGRWFTPGSLVSSTNKIDRLDITEILLKVALKTTTPSMYCFSTMFRTTPDFFAKNLHLNVETIKWIDTIYIINLKFTNR